MATVAQSAATRPSGSGGWLAVLAVWHALLSITAVGRGLRPGFKLVGAGPVVTVAHSGSADPHDDCQRCGCLLHFSS